MSAEIKEIIKRREIKYLLHFTRVENLDSISQHGLIPRNRFHVLGNQPIVNDSYRFDNYLDATSVSIGFPNYKLFYSFRKRDKPVKDWVVLGISPDILWQQKCHFCKTNAANSCVFVIPEEHKIGAHAFEGMFAEIVGKPSRSESRLSNCCTTDPQAEVLVFGVIPTQSLIGVAFQTRTKMQEYAHLCNGLQVIAKTSLFSARHDYSNWKIEVAE